MSANRIAGLGAALTASAGALVTLLGAVPEKWQGPVVIAALVCVTILASVFMLGSQRFDSLIFTQEPSVGPDREEVNVNVGETAPEGTTLIDEEMPGDISQHPDFGDDEVAGHISPDIDRSQPEA